jgi:hypothetical protein
MKILRKKLLGINMRKTQRATKKMTNSNIRDAFIGTALMVSTIFGFNFCNRNIPANQISKNSQCNSKPFQFYGTIKIGGSKHSTNSKFKLKLIDISQVGAKKSATIQIFDSQDNPLKEITMDGFESKTVSLANTGKNKQEDKIQIRVSMIYPKNKSAVISLKECSI